MKLKQSYCLRYSKDIYMTDLWNLSQTDLTQLYNMRDLTIVLTFKNKHDEVSDIGNYDSKVIFGIHWRRRSIERRRRRSTVEKGCSLEDCVL